MAEASLSAAETALENQRIGGLQIVVTALCLLVQVCDGYDVNSVAWAVPKLIGVWHLPPPAFTTAFLWSSIGIMAGALSAGPVGDRIGRKPLLLASLTIFGLASLASAFAGSLGMLTLARFFTGLGIGGAFPGAATLTGDYAPRRRRAMMIMASFTGAPIGGFVGGQIVAVLLPRFGWPVIFILGGVFPLVLVLVLALFLPESPRFLAAKKRLSPRQAALLRRLAIEPGQAAFQPVDIARENPVKLLFSRGYALQTVLLWIIFFCSLMNLFLFGYWMPTVFHLIGMPPAQAVFASSLRDFGAIWAVLYLGWAIDRAGPERSLAFHYAAGAVFIALIALVAMPYALLLAVTFFAGMTIIGSQTGANATAGALYPARMRTSGIGWALGIGRLGGIAAPALGGWLLSLGLKPTHIFLSACLFALIAAAATGLLILRPRPLAAPEAARESAAPAGG
jgi:AAHS family 4-hydroxybenzoate transporter-like MFS transporter